MKVLITDDSATIRMILKGLLKQLKIENVVEAGNGNEAATILARESFDLMLLDIHMPNSDGLVFLEELKKKQTYASLPVIIISSDTTPAQIERARVLGAHAYIKKPFRVEGLREAITSLNLPIQN